MQQKPVNVITIVSAATCLHNLILTRKPLVAEANADREDPRTHDVAPGTWREVQTLTPLQNVGGNRALNVAKRQRNEMKDYYCSPAGAVPWQDRLTFRK